GRGDQVAAVPRSRGVVGTCGGNRSSACGGRAAADDDAAGARAADEREIRREGYERIGREIESGARKAEGQRVEHGRGEDMRLAERGDLIAQNILRREERIDLRNHAVA